MQEEEGERGRNNRSGERERGGETEGEREKARVRARERECLVKQVLSVDPKATLYPTERLEWPLVYQYLS